MLCPAQRICTRFKPTTFEQLPVSKNHNHSYNQNHRHLRTNCCMHRRSVRLTLHNNHLHNHLFWTDIQRINLQSSVLQHKRFWDVVSNA